MAETADAPHPPDGVTLVRAPNPGPMTLDGTNSWVLRAPGASGAIVIDPGPANAAHLERLARGGVELVLITHRHPDHTEAVDAFAALTGAPVRAIDEMWCRGGAPLVDGERIRAGGVELEVLATPGHTSDSACFALVAAADDAPGASDTAIAVFTGDTVLGRGTTIIAHPDGALGPYLDSLARLRELGAAGGVAVLPGHGPVLPDLAGICDAYLAHRQERLDQIRAALARLGADATAEAVTDVVYADVHGSVRFAAEASVRAQLEYLRRG
ncbi:glyoxylase-like metal-dependent hydrolase (beta-lactamase superfamily II) [Agromyces flavus]|uniref:Glyoxylase, beta-lactamase superfamily II n=1 Tax=Agromyces flavus TaxID=589382 RepID=A0A1H1VLS8_9MICO|nr:MBL fold metallo-hydrolase [Agromyces flavus]MCP2365963.1 glyoxylase-like metal-dependent hydrolase (beta-lactamase superfamily II) [Agromyces flavus]SDS85828.1 Glyoxylase, beta-lactamase superfamily II [Agromyces flavus]